MYDSVPYCYSVITESCNLVTFFNLQLQLDNSPIETGNTNYLRNLLSSSTTIAATIMQIVSDTMTQWTPCHKLSPMLQIMVTFLTMVRNNPLFTNSKKKKSAKNVEFIKYIKNYAF